MNKQTKAYKTLTMQLLLPELTLLLSAMLVVTLYVAKEIEHNMEVAEMLNGIATEHLLTERIPVKVEMARYISQLPTPKVETQQKINDAVEVQCKNADTNVLVNKVKGIKPVIRTMNTSSYCSCEKCCNKTDGITASGEKVEAWHTIAAGTEYKIGTIIYIPDLADEPNGGWFIVQDRGGAIKNGKLDIFLNTHQEALQYGRKILTCYIYEF